MDKTRVVWTFEEVHELNSDTGVNPMDQKMFKRELNESNWECNLKHNYDTSRNVDIIIDLLYNDPTPVKFEPNLLNDLEKEDSIEQKMSKKEYKKKGKIYDRK
jgi:hypothetical protein